MADAEVRYFEFGEFRLDVHRRVLRRNGAPVHLTPRSFDLLCVLVTNAGQVMGHDELLEKVWSGTFVEQGNLKKAVSALRVALGEAPGANEFVTTVPRRGYRFSAGVRPITDDSIWLRETHTEIEVEEEIDDQPATATAVATLPHKQKRSWRTPILVGIGATVLVAFAGFFLWRYTRPQPLRFSMQQLQTTRLMSESNMTGGAISPDGALYAFSKTDGNSIGLYVRQVATGSTVQVVAPVRASFWETTFSPDGVFLYYTFHSPVDASQDGVYRVPALGGVPVLIAPKISLGLKFSPDGKRLALYRVAKQDGHELHELWNISAEGGDERRVAVLPVYSLFRGIAWSPDGSAILYGAKKQTPSSKATFYVGEVPIAGGAEKVILPEQENILHVEAWMPDRSSFLLRQREPHTQTFQIWQYFPATREMARITHDDYIYSNLALARDGRTLSTFRVLALASIWQGADAAGDLRQVMSGMNSTYTVDWTPEGRLIFSTTETEREVVGVVNADGSQKRLLTGGEDGLLLNPRLSGDGKRIVFISNRVAGRQAWRIDLDGRNLTQITNNPTGVREAYLLADGKTVFQTTYRTDASRWYVVKGSLEGPLTDVTDSETEDWDISADEKYIAVYLSGSGGQTARISVREMSNGREIASFPQENMWGLRWTRDGKALTFVRVNGDAQEIVYQPIAGGEPRVLTSIRGERLDSFAWAPDGKGVALVRKKIQTEAVLLRAQPSHSNN